MGFVFYLIAALIFFLAAFGSQIFKTVSPIPLGLAFTVLGLICGGGVPSSFPGTWFRRAP